MFRMIKEFMLAPLTIDAMLNAYIVTCIIIGTIAMIFTAIKCIQYLNLYVKEQEIYERLRKNRKRYKA